MEHIEISDKNKPIKKISYKQLKLDAMLKKINTPFICKTDASRNPIGQSTNGQSNNGPSNIDKKNITV